MTSINDSATIIMQENMEDKKEDNIKITYKNLNDKCDIILEKIKKRKIRQSNK
jgi:hypothetical protein